MKSTIYKNIWSSDELSSLQRHFDKMPYSNVQIEDGITWCKDKNLDYHIPISPVYKIIRPKIQEILGDHEIGNGSYKESYFPYATHIDGYRSNFKHNSITDVSQHYVAVLIPLSENEHFATVAWNCFDSDYEGMGTQLKPEWLVTENQIDENLFTHINPDVRKNIPKLPLDKIFNWKMGDCFIWPRNQLHASTDFAKYGLIKKFIVLFIA